MPLRDRVDAGRRLAQRLLRCTLEEPIVVVSLPRGGLPVAAEVARTLHAPLDVLVVRKLGCPWQPELGMGAMVHPAPAGWRIRAAGQHHGTSSDVGPWRFGYVGHRILWQREESNLAWAPVATPGYKPSPLSGVSTGTLPRPSQQPCVHRAAASPDNHATRLMTGPEAKVRRGTGPLRPRWRRAAAAAAVPAWASRSRRSSPACVATVRSRSSGSSLVPRKSGVVRSTS